MEEITQVNEDKRIVTVIYKDYRPDLFEVLSSNSFDPLICKLELAPIVDRLYKANGNLIGKAICHENDEFDYEKGYKLASARAERQFLGVIKQATQILIRRTKKMTEMYETLLKDTNDLSELMRSTNTDEDTTDE